MIYWFFTNDLLAKNNLHTRALIAQNFWEQSILTLVLNCLNLKIKYTLNHAHWLEYSRTFNLKYHMLYRFFTNDSLVKKPLTYKDVAWSAFSRTNYFNSRALLGFLINATHWLEVSRQLKLNYYILSIFFTNDPLAKNGLQTTTLIG